MKIARRICGGGVLSEWGGPGRGQGGNGEGCGHGGKGGKGGKDVDREESRGEIGQKGDQRKGRRSREEEQQNTDTVKPVNRKRGRDGAVRTFLGRALFSFFSDLAHGEFSKYGLSS